MTKHLGYRIILEQKTYDEFGTEVLLDTGYSTQYLEQCEAISSFLRKQPGITNALEIGLAYGISSLFICDALAAKSDNFRYHVSDPMQHSDWRSTGLTNLKKAGFEQYLHFYEDYSYNVLPAMLARKERIQFAYIDSTKLFDYLLTDFFYLDRLMDVGGVVIFDDGVFPAIRKLFRFIAQLPHWEICFHVVKIRQFPLGN